MNATSCFIERSKFPATSRLSRDVSVSSPRALRSLFPRNDNEVNTRPSAWSASGSHRASRTRLNPKSRCVSSERHRVPSGSIRSTPFLRRSSRRSRGHSRTDASTSVRSPPTHVSDRSMGHVAARGFGSNVSCNREPRVSTSSVFDVSPSPTKSMASVPTHLRRSISTRCVRTSRSPRTRLPSHIGRRVAADRSHPRSSSRARDANGARLSSESAEGSCCCCACVVVMRENEGEVPSPV